MRRISDAIVGLILMVVIINLLVGLIAPYSLYIVIAAFVLVAGGLTARRFRQW